MAAATASASAAVAVVPSTSKGEGGQAEQDKGGIAGLAGPSVDRPRASMVGESRREVGSSHVDRNGPTKFYPTIREARRGSGPRPTVATATKRARRVCRVRLLSELRERERVI